ncbi:MAG: RNA-binding S4 domain-containing protein [Bacteroidetes bacterium]|nr:RNA-binding S4 domain-containing protein [Bacteroidota bacterium]
MVSDKIRIDKFLWAVRLYKTRQLSAEACEKGRVKISENTVKPARAIRTGESIVIHRGPWYQHIKVLAITEKRMSAAFVKDFIIDITPAEELDRLKLHQAALASWNIKGGAGRPTKKDRRDMDEFLGDW